MILVLANSGVPVLTAAPSAVLVAPMQLEVEGQTDEHLYFLLAHDSDPFNR